MSLSDRKPMRACGKLYASVEEAARSKAVTVNGHEVVTGEPCGHVHVRKPEKPKTATKTARRDTGPSMETRAMVFARDLASCAGCGANAEKIPHSIQHRNARGMGGTRRPEVNNFSNLVLLCGSATTPGGCHLACERRDPQMHARGLWLESWERPDLIPVAYATPGGVALFRLTDDGARVTEPPERVAA